MRTKIGKLLKEGYYIYIFWMMFCLDWLMPPVPILEAPTTYIIQGGICDFESNIHVISKEDGEENPSSSYVSRSG